MIRIVMLLCVGLLSACGQKGPLFFSPANTEPYTTPERSAPPEFPAPSTTAKPESATQPAP